MAKHVFLEKLYRGFYAKDLSYGNQYPTVLSRLNRSTENNPDTYSRYQDYTRYMTINNDRISNYKDFDMMDNDVIASALDLYADDATQFDPDTGKSFTVNCADKSILAELNHFYFEVLNIDEHIWDVARTAAKYGDFFLRLEGRDGEGIVYANYSLHPSRVSRIDSKGKIHQFIVDDCIDQQPWDFVHFRYPGSMSRDDKTSISTLSSDMDEIDNEYDYPYGTSVLHRARKVWKQISLLEDSLVMLRLNRSVKRNIFMVNSGGLKLPAAWDLVDKITDLLKKKRAINPTTGMLSSTTNLLNPEEDIVIPTNFDKGGITVQEIGGDGDIQHIADLDYMNNKLFAALKIPKAYLGFEEGLNGKNTLRMQDVRYARTIKNVQRMLKVGLIRAGRIHLSHKKIDPFAVNFDITFPYISTIEEEEKAEFLSTKANAMQSFSSTITTVDQDFSVVDKTKLLKYMLKQLGVKEADIDNFFKNNESISKVDDGGMDTNV